MTIKHIIIESNHLISIITPEPFIMKWSYQDDASDWSLSPEKEAAVNEFLKNNPD